MLPACKTTAAPGEPGSFVMRDAPAPAPGPDPVQGGLGAVFHGRRVLVTGHSGFKGSWLCEWLISLGARVTGLSLPPDTSPALFDQLDLAHRMDSLFGDIRSPDTVRRVLREASPEFVFHLAAQPLVRRSYRDPLLTWQTNVIGTLHVLEALRDLDHPCAAILVTTDKCYENREWVHGYRETDPLGGFDPYSSSKAAAEIAIAAWRRSFFRDSPVRLASARAGNVIGGGDWAEDRIVPDVIKALQRGVPVKVRNPRATRPWQHVLEPLSGYLWLAARLADSSPAGAAPGTDSAFNFGPGPEGNRPVRDLVEEILRHARGSWTDVSDPKALHEASLLQLSIDKAAALLGWRPVWSFEESVRATVEWYQAGQEPALAQDPLALQQLTRRQIEAYASQARAQRVAWAGEVPPHSPSHHPSPRP